MRSPARRPRRRAPFLAVRVSLTTVLAGLCLMCAAGARAFAADPTVIAVGDIACGVDETGYDDGAGTPSRCRQQAVSEEVVAPLPAALLVLGDNQYLHGGLTDYESVYDPTFGRANSVVYPALGNAEY